MTVSFQTRTIDNWHYISHLVTTTITGRCFFGLYLAAPAVFFAWAMYHIAPGPKMQHMKMQHMMMLFFLPVTGGFYLLCALAVIIGLFLGSAIAPRTTITIDSQFCCRETLFKQKAAWTAFASLTEGVDHYFFTGWRYAFFLPKLAFDSRAEADAFYRTALLFWREAKGLPEPSIPAVPNVSRVWPPAPRPGNSAEPGDGPEC